MNFILLIGTKNREAYGNIALQTEYVLKNIERALTSCDATLDDLFKLTIYIVQGQDIKKGFEGAQKFLRKLGSPRLFLELLLQA